MQKITLTSDEKRELGKRGFLVKKGKFLKNILGVVCIHLGHLFPLSFFMFAFMGIIGILILLISSSSTIYTLTIWIGVIIGHYPIFKLIIASILYGNTFYSENGIINFGKYYSDSDIFKKSKYYSTLKYLEGLGFVGYFFVIFCFLWIFTFGLFIVSVEDMNIFNFCLIPIGIICLHTFLLPILKYTFQSIHPLYAFGNLGEKIQKLTPTIESKSKEIQENFEKDMSFRVLSTGFDSLSSTFSEIVGFVIRLEQVEKKANKGNLFDSEKYINSLRGDIFTPLNSLKSFLEEQREKLLESQKELKKIQVRVGGNTEITSESELSSKRSESLLVELDENISKLEEMIKKI